MKKIVLVMITISFLASCAPRRARCYGKRCVENSVKRESSTFFKRDS